MVYTSLPENYFRNTGQKLIDVERSWAYEHNPFVLRDEDPDEVIDLWRLPLGDGPYASLALRICEAFQLPMTYLRHARLYAYEDAAIDNNAVVIHVTGMSAAATSMPDHVIEHIATRYQGYTIFQIGALTDKATPFIDKRGLPLWDSIRLIATSGTFIGVDSGPMNVANCYPRIRRKVILLRDVQSHVPVAHPLRWIDFNWEYFNISADDKGISMAYWKL